MHLVFNFVLASFYQNDVLFDYSIKMSRFMPIWGFCADAFRAASIIYSSRILCLSSCRPVILS